MNIRQLRYFVAIVEAGSLSRAAERVHVAQSALSSQVRAMEELLGVTLLVRGPKGIDLTPAGAKLLKHAQVILEQVSLAERELRGNGEKARGPVTIGIPSGAGRVLNRPLLEASERELPEVSLRIVEVLPGQVRDWLAEGLIKLGVYYELGSAANVDPPLAVEEFFLVSGSPEPGLGDEVNFASLARYPLILPTCNFNPQQCPATFAETMGIHLQVETRVDSLATILDLVCSRPGRTLLTPACFLPEWRAGGVHAYRIVPVISRKVMLSVGSRQEADTAVRAVEVMVRQVATMLTAGEAWPQRLPAVPGSQSQAVGHLVRR